MRLRLNPPKAKIPKRPKNLKQSIEALRIGAGFTETFFVVRRAVSSVLLGRPKELDQGV